MKYENRTGRGSPECEVDTACGPAKQALLPGAIESMTYTAGILGEAENSLKALLSRTFGPTPQDCASGTEANPNSAADDMRLRLSWLRSMAIELRSLADELSARVA